MGKPNILWIYCDELRADALGCYNNHKFSFTPNIDLLAVNGIQFKNCFCNSTVCMSSRVSMLTGLSPEKTGVFGNSVSPTFGDQYSVFKTFPEVLADNDYKTVNFGKEHLPSLYCSTWQYSITSGADVTDLLNENVDQRVELPGVPVNVGGRYLDKASYPPVQITRNATNYLNQNETPFLLRVSYLQPHTPVFAPEPYFTKALELFGGGKLSEACCAFTLSDFEQRFSKITAGYRLNDSQRLIIKASYHALVMWLDEQVGALMRALEYTGKAANTIVVLCSDHGVALGENNLYLKQTFTKQVQRIPLIISWPGVLNHRVDNKLCEAKDLAKTLLEFVDINVPEQFEGRNLVSDVAPNVIFATTGTGAEGDYAFPNRRIGRYTGDRGWPRRLCIRSEQFRLDKNYLIDGKMVDVVDEDMFFTDYISDPDESKNLKDNITYQPYIQELDSLLKEYLQQI